MLRNMQVCLQATVTQETRETRRRVIRTKPDLPTLSQETRGTGCAFPLGSSLQDLCARDPDNNAPGLPTR